MERKVFGGGGRESLLSALRWFSASDVYPLARRPVSHMRPRHRGLRILRRSLILPRTA